MAEEPWNKVNIPFPSAISTSLIAFTDDTANTIKYLLDDCDRVLTLLCSEVLQTEIRVLYEILYILNNSFRQHKPFRAIKQVEQCLNRLKEMKLKAALLDLKELCPKNVQRKLGTACGQCDVPSQPMLEWFCLKVLGASSLLSRLLDHCSRAFTLTRRHLQLEEFIILNLVLTSMLSRLWAFFRGVLRGLVPLYERALDLLAEVAQAQPMPYLTKFTLPRVLPELFGSWYVEPRQSAWGLRVKGAPKASLLNRLFGGEAGREGEEEREEQGGENRQQPGNRSDGQKVDLGMAVIQRRPKHLGSVSRLDLKAMLKRPYGDSRQVAVEVPAKMESLAKGRSAFQDLSVIGQKRQFLKLLKTISSLRNMATHMQEMIQWCKSRKLREEGRRLAFLSLRCQRMKHLEAEGFSVQRKLKRFRLDIGWALMLRRSSLPRPYRSLHARWRSCFRTVKSHYRIIGSRSGTAGKRSRTVKTLFREARTTLPRMHAGTDGKNRSAKLCCVNNEDIDDIFASIGF